MKQGVVLERIYLSYLNDWISRKSRKPLILRGARQVGKSYLVRDFARRVAKPLYEINLERHKNLDSIFQSFDISKITTVLESVFKSSFSDGILFLDEIQATPHAIAALRYFYEDRPDQIVIAAGSLLEFTLSDHNFSMPVGRIEYLHIGPLTFEEYLKGTGETWVAENFTAFKIGESIPAELHRQLLEHYKNFLFLGGMPESVQMFVKEKDIKSSQRILENIKNTYEDDFAKYAKKVDLDRLQNIYRAVPNQIGKKAKYSNILTGEKANVVRRNIDLLIKARIALPCFHSSCSGIPIEAQKDNDIYKLFWIDVGLLNRMHDVDWFTFSKLETRLLTEGALAEQFVAQHFAIRMNGEKPPSLFYWLREGKSNNAEVDFVLQVGADVVPIEVKSGAIGSLKSILQFVAEKSAKVAVRFDRNEPTIENIEQSVVTGEGSKKIKFTLISLPIYFAGRVENLFK